MYLHIGNNILINKKDIIAICDMDIITSTDDGKEFIYKTAPDKLIDDLSGLLPKSLIIASDRFNRYKLYLSCLTTYTLEKRLSQRFM